MGPDLGEEFEVRLEKGKTLQVKLLTPGLSVSAAICRLCLTNKFHYRNILVFSCQKVRILALTDNAMMLFMKETWVQQCFSAFWADLYRY